MIIKEFNRNYIEEAMTIALSEYEEERKQLSYLPALKEIPDLSHFADNGLGVAMFEGDRMLGFLGTYLPIDNAFGTTKVKGTFSPIHAHGVMSDQCLQQFGSASWNNRTGIYSRLYQEAAERWVKAGILSHGIAMFERDREGINSFFCNGFGLRCVDAVRSLDKIPGKIALSRISEDEIVFTELPGEDFVKLLSLNNDLIAHLGKSPTFMSFDPIDETEFLRRSSKEDRYFTAEAGSDYVAYIKLSQDGENYITESNHMMNITGAYCKPDFRGTGLYHNLLVHLMTVLKKEGYQLLGVDFESINPTARGFWLKYFTAYTQSVVRRIDDKAID